MAVVARRKLGMSLEDFYRCTWKDWGMWVERILEVEDHRRNNHELLIELFRSSLSRYFNWNRGNGAPIYPEDVWPHWPLSYDKPRTDVEPDPEEKLKVIQDLEERVKRRRNRG